MTNLNPNSVIYIAEKILGLDLLSNSRKEEYIEGRAIVYYILRHKLGMTYHQVVDYINENCTPDKDGRKDIKIKACEDQIFLLNSKIKELKKELNELYNKKHARRL